ncbi:MAG: hypothetical protein U5J62_09905 [Desulfurivibrio sp.]|nr:hypothetical protein [Desulfurivibrio sp.]
MLTAAGLLSGGRSLYALGKNAGLIGATTTGSLGVDLDFASTLAAGFYLASPALFGYTLPNIALSEAASHYGLVGPVYAIFPDQQTPLTVAVVEAERWLACRPELDLIIAGAFDAWPGSETTASLSITLSVVS